MNFRINWEALGIAASVACAIHCALMPLIITSLPLIGAGFLKSMVFELALLLMAFAMGFYSLWHGYRRHHHKPLTLLLFSTGMLFFLLHQLVHIPHSVLLFILPGITLILSAHYFNFRFCRIAKHCHSSDCNH